jgi:hypothetical protein
MLVLGLKVGLKSYLLRMFIIPTNLWSSNIINDHEPENCVLTRELEESMGIFFPLRFIASTQGWNILYT